MPSNLSIFALTRSNDISERLKHKLLNLNPLILLLWSLVNIIVPIVTLFYYFWQFDFYHPLLWIFIPDSYSFAILFGIFIIITLIHKRNIQFLNIIIFVGLVKVFIGYVLIFTLMPSFFDLVSLSAHTLELTEGLLVLPFIKTDMKHFLAANLILVIDWFFDFNIFFLPRGVLPTLALYPYHQLYNPDNTAPYIGIFFIVFTITMILLLFLIRFFFWAKDKQSINWIEFIGTR
ncbi:MAG: DUF1405 domain-containing protein [Candidatus Hodarchaeales archaeon]